MEFGIEKYVMLVMKSGKRHMTDRMALPNKDKIRTHGENETYKYVGILEAATIKQDITGELENFSRQNSQAETLSKE